MLFTLRAHNAVNRRLSKPVYQTVQACFDLLRQNVRFNKTQGFRITYTNHITRHWRMFQDASGLAAMKKIHEIKKIEVSYMSQRSNEFEVMIPDENVAYIPNGLPNEPLRPVPFRSPGRMVMTSAGFRIQR